MENIDSIWFYLEPYVFISEESGKYLFYNTVICKGLLVEKSDAINKIISHLQQPENMYSVWIAVKDLDDNRLYECIQSLQEGGYGDMVEGELPKPVIMPPLLNLQKSVERMKKNDLPIGDNIMSYLHEVTIHVNGECVHHCPGCQGMFKQWPCCTKSDTILDFKLLNEFLYAIAYTPAAVNITGGNPFQYPKLHELLEVLGRRVSMQTFIVNYRNIPDDLDRLYIFTNESFRLKIMVNDSYQADSLVAVADRLKQGNIRQLWEICITSVSEYEKAEQLSEQFAERDIEVKIRPFYNGENLAFFEDNIFVQQEDLLAVALDRQEVFALQELNTYDFGKITVTSDGKVYANVNREQTGNIREPAGIILCRELENGTSWRNTRYRIEPCSHCCFKLICPSPSNYETAIGKPNLCHVK